MAAQQLWHIGQLAAAAHTLALKPAARSRLLLPGRLPRSSRRRSAPCCRPCRRFSRSACSTGAACQCRRALPLLVNQHHDGRLVIGYVLDVRALWQQKSGRAGTQDRRHERCM